MSFVIYRTDTTEAINSNKKVYGIQYYKTKGACTTAMNKIKREFAEGVKATDHHDRRHHKWSDLEILVPSDNEIKNRICGGDLTGEMVELAIADADIYHTKIEATIEVEYDNRYAGGTGKQTMTINEKGGACDRSMDSYWCN